MNTCDVFPLDSWICGFNSSFGIHFKSHRNASSVTALCSFFVFSLSGGCCLLQSLGPRTRRGREKTYIAAGHNWEKNNVSNWRGQQDDRKCLQGIALLSDCHRDLVKPNCLNGPFIYVYCCQQGILDQFNPSLKNFVTMGKHYEKALTG